MKATFILPHLRLSDGIKALLEHANHLALLSVKTLIVIPENHVKWYRILESVSLAKKVVIPVDPESIDWFPNKVPIIKVPIIKN